MTAASCPAEGVGPRHQTCAGGHGAIGDAAVLRTVGKGEGAELYEGSGKVRNVLIEQFCA